MENIEYIQSNAPVPPSPFFPSLEKLEFEDMPNLKGWWRDIRWMEKEEGVGLISMN